MKDVDFEDQDLQRKARYKDVHVNYYSEAQCSSVQEENISELFLILAGF